LPAHYNPALDGIRAIAVLLVMAFHPGIPGFKETFIYGSLMAFIAAAISYHLMEQRISHWRRKRASRPDNQPRILSERYSHTAPSAMRVAASSVVPAE